MLAVRGRIALTPRSIYSCPVQNTLAVLLEGSCLPYREVLALGRQCGLVYGLLWESAYKDLRRHQKFPTNRKLACGGCTDWSVKGIARECHLGKASVIEALKALLDAGFIQYAGEVVTSNGYRRRWRATHPSQLKAVRHAISVMGLPSLKYNESATHHDEAQLSEREAGEDPAEEYGMEASVECFSAP